MEFLKSIGLSALEIVCFLLEMAFLIWVYDVVLGISASAAGMVAAVFMIWGAIRTIYTVIKVASMLFFGVLTLTV